MHAELFGGDLYGPRINDVPLYNHSLPDMEINSGYDWHVMSPTGLPPWTTQHIKPSHYTDQLCMLQTQRNKGKIVCLYD